MFSKVKPYTGEVPYFCAIQQEHVDEPGIITACNHIFSETAFKEYYNTGMYVCPSCRRDLRSVFEKINLKNRASSVVTSNLFVLALAIACVACSVLGDSDESYRDSGKYGTIICAAALSLIIVKRALDGLRDHLRVLRQLQGPSR